VYDVAVFPEGTDINEFDWRISLAAINASSRFSVFPGVDRILTVIDGGTIVLTVDGVEFRPDRLVPIEFPGDTDTVCDLSGEPVRVLNVMVRRGRFRAGVFVLPGAATVECVPEPGLVNFLAILDGRCVVDATGVVINAVSVVRIERPLTFTRTGRVARVVIEACASESAVRI
jgi:uncharacterized protein